MHGDNSNFIGFVKKVSKTSLLSHRDDPIIKIPPYNGGYFSFGHSLGDTIPQSASLTALCFACKPFGSCLYTREPLTQKYSSLAFYLLSVHRQSLF